jgi:hypothetical protein
MQPAAEAQLLLREAAPRTQLAHRRAERSQLDRVQHPIDVERLATRRRATATN